MPVLLVPPLENLWEGIHHGPIGCMQFEVPHAPEIAQEPSVSRAQGVTVDLELDELGQLGQCLQMVARQATIPGPCQVGERHEVGERSVACRRPIVRAREGVVDHVQPFDKGGDLGRLR